MSAVPALLRFALQDTFREARAANASSPAAGAMFWGATVGDHIDWDGWQVRLDGGRTGGQARATSACPAGEGLMRVDALL